MRRFGIVVVAVLGCAPLAEVHYDFTYAAARATNETDLMGIELRHDEPNRPYVVLGDVEVTMRQQGSFGDIPDHDGIDDELRVRAAVEGQKSNGSPDSASHLRPSTMQTRRRNALVENRER